MKKYLLLFTCIAFFVSCKKEYQAPVPDMSWDLFDAAGIKLKNNTCQKLEGVYNIETGKEDFGDLTALKWSYSVSGMDTTFYFSFFCANEVSYLICEGKRVDSSILLNGYWRKMVNTGTGKVRLTITSGNGAAYLLDSSTSAAVVPVIITGQYGIGEDLPDKPLTFTYNRALYHTTPLEIVAHRGGGRTSDLLPASENSVEMIRMASRFGATGIEIDVRLTKDGIPILFHDATLNERVIQKNGLLGPIQDYTYAQLNSLVRLTKGEPIPTLREALNTMVYETPLHFVWLDIKLQGSLEQIRTIQKEFVQKANAIGRNVEITIGIPDETVLKNFLSLNDYEIAPSVCELSITDVVAANARIWGPRWTLGLQNNEVDEIHSEGRRAFVWTLDEPENINKYLTLGKFDGLLTNYPSAVAYYYYAKQ